MDLRSLGFYFGPSQYCFGLRIFLDLCLRPIKSLGPIWKIGPQRTLGDYFRIWAFGQFALGLGHRPIIGKGKKVFYPSLDSLAKLGSNY